ncbi:class I SAM-dependent methyltransferase [Christiangramia aquimixticola]|uniref:class I SAM-dependent methyltransferase n=1 Tax=Christiangramia aquimixticola TaxID=1697558 RepID=UPI003AA9A737
MTKASDYLNINRESWNNRLVSHITSDFYDVENFKKGKNSLNSIELELFGELKGKKVLHLQCHFGQDTISLARMGAECVGVDLSNKAIKYATQLNEELGTNARFICSDIYALPEVLNEKFDIVFTSYGTIGWLPDLEKWAAVISKFLKKGGKFVFAEFHPVVWMFDDNFKKIAYPYRSKNAIIESETGTYADKDAAIEQEFVVWNHGISDVLSGLIEEGLQIEKFEEFDYSPYNCFNGTKEFEPGKYYIEHLQGKIPMVYALTARK